jgi:hypothetical protein
VEAARGQRDAAIGPMKKGNAKLVFQRPDAGGDIRLNRVQLVRRAAHIAESRYRLEHPQIRRVHRLLP